MRLDAIYSENWEIKKEGNELSPYRIKTETKFTDISSHYISIALSQSGIYYNWGKCGEEIIRTPKPTDFKSFVDIYAKYFKITKKAINFGEQNSVSSLKAIKNEAASDFSSLVLSGSSAMAPAVEQINNSVHVIKSKEENGEKVKANKTDNNLGSAVNRFNSQPNETLREEENILKAQIKLENRKEEVKEPKETELKSFNDIKNHFEEMTLNLCKKLS